MPVTGRAVAYDGTGEHPNVFKIMEFPVPEPGPGAVLLKMALANVCGSDVHGWRGDNKHAPRSLPRHQGHEGVARVAVLGEGVTSDANGEPLAVGDRVIFHHFYPCGRCRACVAGQDGFCPSRRDNMAPSVDTWPYFRGAFADYYYMFPGHVLLKVPDDLSDDLVAGVNCAFGQVYCGLELAGLKIGEYVVIQGAGGLGIYAIAVARERGAGKIIVIDGIQERLDLAAAFGADELIDMRELPTPEQRIKRVKELTGGWGAEVGLELVGYPKVVDEGTRMMGQGGRYVEIGCRSPGFSYPAEPEQWATGNIQIIGNNNFARRHLIGALELLERTRDKYPYERVVSHKFPLERVNEALAAQAEGHVTRASLVP